MIDGCRIYGKLMNVSVDKSGNNSRWRARVDAHVKKAYVSLGVPTVDVTHVLRTGKSILATPDRQQACHRPFYVRTYT